MDDNTWLPTEYLAEGWNGPQRQIRVLEQTAGGAERERVLDVPGNPQSSMSIFVALCDAFGLDASKMLMQFDHTNDVIEVLIVGQNGLGKESATIRSGAPEVAWYFNLIANALIDYITAVADRKNQVGILIESERHRLLSLLGECLVEAEIATRDQKLSQEDGAKVMARIKAIQALIDLDPEPNKSFILDLLETLRNYSPIANFVIRIIESVAKSL